MWNLLQQRNNRGLDTKAPFRNGVAGSLEVIGQSAFLKMLALERKRADRSSRRFLLMLLESQKLLKDSSRCLGRVIDALAESTRETDVKGWYEEGTRIGVIFTEIDAAPEKSVCDILHAKVTNALNGQLSVEEFKELSLSFHEYPEGSNRQDPPAPANSILYPDIAQRASSNSSALRVKRAIDILGSLFGLVLFAPLLAVIAILIKATSKGPVLFRQKRLGHYGKSFVFLKFRSMYVNNDHTIHKEYVTQFIAARNGNQSRKQNQQNVYKLVGDPRITPVGKFLRRTSLDELPQFFNVLKGEMSLVGPRPPLPYEFKAYEAWHRRRLLVMKPGITGLWQVAGRSKVTFDEMVRLDLQYAKSWSLGLDIKILLQTPLAVVTAQGAY